MQPEDPNLQPNRPSPSGPGRPMSRPQSSSDSGGSISDPPPPSYSQGAPATPEPPKKSSGGMWLGGIVVAAVLAVGYLFFGGAPSASTPPANAPIQQSIAAAETESPEFAKHKNRAPGASASLSAADLDPAQTQAAIEAAKAGRPIPGLSGASPELVSAIEKGDVKFYRVRAYDTCAEDGDWVTITTSNGAKMGSFLLTKVGSSMSIPVVGGQIPNVQLVADKDGVGGVTVGVTTSGGTWYSGVLSPGETEQIPMTMN